MNFIKTRALIKVSFSNEGNDPVTLKAMKKITEIIEPYDSSVRTEVGKDTAATLAAEMQIIIVIAAFIIVAVLLFTSKSYGEIPVLLITFSVAALLNMGTNFLFGEISFISNSVAVVLQLALAIDYAIILCHRFTEERAELEAREACIVALSKAIPEIFSSSLTTVCGLAALAFMHFNIGLDLSMVLIKSIILSLLCVFTLMPGLLMLFSNLMDKSKHKNFVPSMEALGKFSLKTRKIIPPIFVVVIIISFVLSNKCPYQFGVTECKASRQNDTQIQTERIKEKFGTTNMVALVVPTGDYEKEKLLLTKLEKYKEVDSTTGLSNTEAKNGYVVTDALTPREFSELVDIDYEVVRLLYSAYAANDEDFSKIVNGASDYAVPLLDMFQFVYDGVEEGYVSLDQEIEDELEELNEQLRDGKAQLLSDKYSRMLLFLDMSEEGEETYKFLGKVQKEMEALYGKDVYIVGNSTSNEDLSATFSQDNVLIGILSALFVIIVLIGTFKSVGLPNLLIIVIQAAIWINFSFPYLQGKGLFFIGYLVVSSIQMGANVDYAIVITSRYMSLKDEYSKEEAIIKAVDQAFPTIITSGTILASAGIVIQNVTTDGIIAIIGECLGRGTIISIILVLFVLPQMLYLGDALIEKTSFSVKLPSKTVKQKGKMSVNGRVRGYVNGTIDANISGTITGDLSAMVDAGDIKLIEEEGGSDDEK